jgi:soluble lytic murein transglycosylase-like protein
MSESSRLVLIRHLEHLEALRRRVFWGVGVLSCLAVTLAVGPAGPLMEVLAARATRLAEASSPHAGSGERSFQSALDDPLYDQFLQEFMPLRNDPERRRYLTAQVLAAAGTYRLDPDMLFALIAVESGFNAKAVSHKGARGLGQMQFRTAHAVAPLAVRQPEDLHEVARNLYATARHLRHLLDDRAGDLRAALCAYYGGPCDRNTERHARDTYVSRVSAFYAYLKARRTHRYLTAGAPTQAAEAKPRSGERADSAAGRRLDGESGKGEPR